MSVAKVWQIAIFPPGETQEILSTEVPRISVTRAKRGGQSLAPERSEGDKCRGTEVGQNFLCLSWWKQ